MNVNRREFIAASAVLGAAAALTPKLGGAGSWFGGTKAGDQALSGLQILRSAQAEAEGFEKGVREALKGVGADLSKVASRTLSGKMSWTDWQSLTAMAPGTVLVGMVTESEFVLINEIFRETGARVLSQGTHVTGDSSHSRHAFTTTESSAGLGSAFARWLKSQNHHALVQETSTRKGALALTRSQKSEAHSGGWFEMLGHALAKVAVGRWEPGKIEGRIQVGAGDAFATPKAGYVSFVATV